jgi:hypothetical protein
MFLLCINKSCTLFKLLIPLSTEKKFYWPSCSVPSLSDLTSCNYTKPNLHFDTCFEIVICESVLFRLLIFHVPTHVSIFLTSVRLCTESVQFQGSLRLIVTENMKDRWFSVVLDFLFNIFAVSFHIRRLSLLSATRGRFMLWRQGAYLTL